MSRLSDNSLKKIEIIKKAILFSGGLVSKFGRDNVHVELMDYDLMDEDNFYELLFGVIIKEYDCDDCSHEMEMIRFSLQEIKNIIEESSNFKVKPNLNITHGNSTRGVLLNSFSYSYDELQNLDFTIYIDPN